MGSKLDITVLSGVSSGDVFHFNIEPNSSVSIGRATECEIVLHDPTVSRKHGQIERRSDGFFIVDQGSTHGTFHMGFHLKSGPENARQLHSGDEFKIGELLFRVGFDESEFSKKIEEKKKPKAATGSKLPPYLRGRKGIGIGLIALVLLILLLLPEEKKGLPPQRSNDVISVPNFAVAGYMPGSAAQRREERDSAHLDKAQFDIPASDVLIEYSITSEAPIKVLLDDVSVEQIPESSNWQTRQLIIRGVALGKQRKIIFDNLDYPRGPEAQGPLKKWGVRDMRAAPLVATAGIEPGFDSQLNAAIGLVEGIDKGPEGMFLLIRALQSASLELLKELKLDVVGLRVDPTAEDTIKVNDLAGIKARLELIKNGRERDYSSAAGSSYLKDLTYMISQLDAELWRRVNNRMYQARMSATVKNFIDAHDQLLSAMAMFPAEADYRWTLVNKMFMDIKIVPKRVREEPHAYRK